METETHGLDTQEQVFFYEQYFYPFSNFSSFQITYNGITFQTSEHFYHWMKFVNRKDIQDDILNAKSAHEAFKIANQNKKFYHKDWEDNKFEIMQEILRLKTLQHEYVKHKLIQSGNRQLVENSWRDNVWGWGPNKDGQNLLGKAWMLVREDFINNRLHLKHPNTINFFINQGK